MNQLQKTMIHAVLNERADLIMAQYAYQSMLAKLNEKRDEGRHGWFNDYCSKAELLEMLKEHVEAGDMVDVLNIAGMILAREALYGE